MLYGSLLDFLIWTGTERPERNRGVPTGIFGTGRNENRDETTSFLSRFSHLHGMFRPFWPERHEIYSFDENSINECKFIFLLYTTEK